MLRKGKIAMQHPSKSSKTLTHPLATDEGGLVIVPFIDLLSIDPAATLVDLVLESTAAAKIIMDQYRTNSRLGRYNALLFQSILALFVLHQRGAGYKLLGGGGGSVTEEEHALISVVNRVYGESKVAPLVKAYGLDTFEHNAIKAYSSPNKNDKEINGRANPYFMGTSSQWGKYGDGWIALTSALKKLPTLGDLGLILTTYRATRTKKPGEVMEAEALRQLAPESHVHLGIKIMDMGQYHFTSTAITYNPHWGRVLEVGGILAITGYSGVYINPFGIQTFVDGGEILYPPNILTTYEGMNPDGYQTSEGSVPVFHLREVRRPESYQRVVEDSDFEIRQDRHPNLDKKKMEIIQRIEATVQIYGVGVLNDARKDTNISGPIMYLTIDELLALYRRLPLLPEYRAPEGSEKRGGPPSKTTSSSTSESEKDQLIAEVDHMLEQNGSLLGEATGELNIRRPLAHLSVEEIRTVIKKMKEIAARGTDKDK
jgi:hypothetical protein